MRLLIILLIFALSFIIKQQTYYELTRGRYLVVGNCVRCLPHNIKQIVTQFDGTVILFNNNRNFENLNANTIVLCNSVNKRVLLTKKLTANQPLVFIDTPDNDIWTHRVLNGVYALLYNAFHNKCIRFMTMDARISRISTRPTTGFMVIMHLVSNGSDVYFTGFDPNDNSINGKNDIIHHDFHTERRILNELVHSSRSR